MKAKKIAIVGATGFLGQATERYFSQRGWETVRFTRDQKKKTQSVRWAHWNPRHPEAIARHLEGVDAVINLAGRSVDCRYNRKNKADILNSRLETTRAIGKAIEQCQAPPKVWLNASSATIYEEAFENPQTEENGILGQGFSVSICRAWENAFFTSNLPSTRKVALRTALVLGHGRNSVYPRLAQLARMGLGGTIGNGRQMVSWIHQLDFVRALAFLISDETLEGVFNLAAPAPLDNRTFMKSLREKAGRALGIPTPKWLLEIGTFLLRTESELVLKSRFVVPDRLVKERFIFRYPFIDEAFDDLANQGTEPQPFPRQQACPSA